MHRTKGTTPEADAWKKVKVLGIRYGRILDTCTGLGYTALAAIRLGGNIVVSSERRPEVLRIGVMNPWSRELFDDERIRLLIGDVYSLVEALPDEFFNYVIHDPPRFAAPVTYTAVVSTLGCTASSVKGGVFSIIRENGSQSTAELTSIKG